MIYLSTTNVQGFIYYFGIFYLKIGKFYTFFQLGKGPVMGPKISPGKSLFCTKVKLPPRNRCCILEISVLHYLCCRKSVVCITKTCPCNKQRLFELKKMKIISRKNLIFFLFFAQNIDCGYTLEPPRPRRGGSNEYPQSMFWSKNKKNRYTPAYPSFAI